MRSWKKVPTVFKKKEPRHPVTARLLHWLYAPAILAGILSGFYIKKPSRLRGFKSIYSAQKVHFMAQYFLLFSYLARVYYGYIDKNYKQIIPNRKTIKQVPSFLKYQFFLTNKKPKYPKYNPGQKILFTVFFLLIPIQIITGIALYAPKIIRKPAVLVGGLNSLRKLHYLTALSISSMTAGHLYFVFTDSLQKLKSIFTGRES